MAESRRSQPHQTPNSPVAAVKGERIIEPELLRAIVNGDLKGFKEILGREDVAPNDRESIVRVGNGGSSGLRKYLKGFKEILGIEDVAPNDRESIVRVGNGGSSGLRGVTCGGNTALHVVVMEKSSPINSLLPVYGNTEERLAIMIANLIILLTNPLRHTFLLVVSTKKIQRWIAAAKKTQCLKWVFHGPEKENVSVRHKSTTYGKIARIIYHLVPTLLNARNNAMMETPLHGAAKAGKLEMVSLLVQFAREEGTQKLEEVLWARNKVGETALHEAARSGYSGVVKELLSADDYLSFDFISADESVTISVDDFISARTHISADESVTSSVVDFISADESVTSSVEDFISADESLTSSVEDFISADESFTSSVEDFISANESVTSSVENNADETWTSFIFRILRFVFISENPTLDVGVTNNPLANCALFPFSNLANLVDDNGISPLYLAVAAGCLDVVDMLIAPDREPSYAGPDEQTALHAAVLTREENIMRAILEWKPALAAKTDKAQNTPLHYAALIGNTNAAKQLLLKDTKSVYKANSSGSFPVHLAAEAGKIKVIRELLRTCPDVGELLDNEQRNFLHIAVEKKKERVIMLAYKEGINVNVINAKDKDGNTPLHLAVINSESEIFALLCQNKRVNPHIRNEAGLTPLDLSASLKDHQFTYTLNPQSIIHRALVTRGAFQNPCQPDLSKTVNNFLKARADRLNQREGKEMFNGVEVDIEKESTKYENMSKSLITGAVLIASATYVSTFTVSRDYREEKTPHTLMRRNFFKAFIIVNMAAFICAIVSTIWLLYSALSNFHLKYRKSYFKWSTKLLHLAINLFILTFGLGAYITIAPLSKWMALVILLVSGVAVLGNIISSANLVPLIFLVPYMSTEYQ